ncbi:hypothetical protein [Andreprevotia chitinilytica]|uniref:hypothetical protein n=1 Tax=Andreprevotia chitinilytica TaxID=396808 RepID=UPI0005588D65|nr:hypothetical protein [Andreprevotia chitinilytica]
MKKLATVIATVGFLGAMGAAQAGALGENFQLQNGQHAATANSVKATTTQNSSEGLVQFIGSAVVPNR